MQLKLRNDLFDEWTGFLVIAILVIQFLSPDLQKTLPRVIFEGQNIKINGEVNENIGACDNIQIVHISKQILHGHSFTSETEITESRKPKLCKHINIQ